MEAATVAVRCEAYIAEDVEVLSACAVGRSLDEDRASQGQMATLRQPDEASHPVASEMGML